MKLFLDTASIEENPHDQRLGGLGRRHDEP